MNSRSPDIELTNLTDPDIASIKPEGSLITSPKPNLSRRWLVLTLALAGCNQAVAASPYRLLLPRTDRNSGDGTPILEPTPTPDTRPSYPWPAEVLPQLRVLPVLDKNILRFGYYTDISQVPYPDLREAWAGKEGGAGADVPRRMVQLYTHQELTNMWVLLTIAHEIGHFHQAEQSRLIGMDSDARPNFQEYYLNTPEGRTFVAAGQAASSNARSRGEDFTYPFPWKTRVFESDYYESTADVIGIWYQQPQWLDGDVLAPLRTWSQRWLPKAIFGPADTETITPTRTPTPISG